MKVIDQQVIVNSLRRTCELKRRFSVEAKSRPAVFRGDGKLLRVGRQLHGALEKNAKFERLVFIELNRPAGLTKEEVGQVVDRAVAIIKQHPKEYLLMGNLRLPRTSVLLTIRTNMVWMLQVDLGAAFLGYKISDFGEGAKFESIRAAVRAREKHIEMFDLRNRWSTMTYCLPPLMDNCLLPYLEMEKLRGY